MLEPDLAEEANIRRAVRPLTSRPLISLASDPQFFGALLAGPIVWTLIAWLTSADVAIAFPPRLLSERPMQFAMLVLAYPVLEEFVFRGWLQPAFATRIRRGALLGLSPANLVTSALFAAAHFLYHPPLMALATFFPSLVFGHLRERYNHVLPGIMLHAYYNAGYFWLFG